MKSFFLNLILIILLAIGIGFAFFAFLGHITRHGESVMVPNVTGQNINAAAQYITSAKLKPVVTDSVFIDSLPPLSIVSQTPTAGSSVKEGRTVYMTINQAVAPMVQMPDLKGYSFKSATLLLKSFGLRVGSSSYTSSLVKDAVIKQQINGADIAAGTKLPMGSIIDLIIGDGTGSQLISVPNILGMQVAEARSYIMSLNCNIGMVTPDIDVAHSDSAYIYKQSPASETIDSMSHVSTPSHMKMGGFIDVWVSKNPPVPQQ